MAKAKTAALVRMTTPRVAAPIIRVVAPRAAVAKKVKRHVKHHASKYKIMGIAIAGYILGHLDKAGTAIPTIPVLGKAGTLAVGLHFFAPKGEIWQQAAVAAAAIAGYEMGKTGAIAGGVARQIAGVHGAMASQV